MMRWDIFCHVIDNYGDVGVCWRLSRQLVMEYGFTVRLWVDDMMRLQRICPVVDARLAIQSCRGVEVRHWCRPFPNVTPADVVIEAFGCELPENYVSAMAGACSRQHDQIQDGCTIITEAGTQRAWINLEYLSAEQWVEGCHGLASPHPRMPLTKYFFFPGFTAATGGLLREKGLLAQREAFQSDTVKFWRQLGLAPPAATETVVSLFCYDNAPVSRLLDCWAASVTPVRCLVPASHLLQQIAGWTGIQTLAPGASVLRGNLTLHIIPFLPQEDYDALLWACDCNFVRGEDSFVRAQWAARPLVWHIYPQQDQAHLAKLEAFLNRYCHDLMPAAAAAVRTFHRQWNGDGNLDWNGFWQSRAQLQRHAMAWAERLARFKDLAYNLVHFCKDRTNH
jgi:uncharacterized repeat protein (TIGR03837 family)